MAQHTYVTHANGGGGAGNVPMKEKIEELSTKVPIMTAFSSVGDQISGLRYFLF